VTTSRRRETGADFRESLPSLLIPVMVHAVQEAYARAAADRARRGPEGFDLHGHLVRAEVEGGLARRLNGTPGVSLLFLPNKARSSHHLEIRLGHIVIIPAAVESRSAMVRPADFRTTLAEGDQMELALSPSPPAVAGGERLLFLLLLHGPCGAGMPRFIDLVPPARDCRSYVDTARLRLLDETADSLTPPIREVVPAPMPTLMPSFVDQERDA